MKHSGDSPDAADLPQPCGWNCWRRVSIHPREERGPRDLARKRMQLVVIGTARSIDRGTSTREMGPGPRGEAVKRLNAE